MAGSVPEPQRLFPVAGILAQVASAYPTSGSCRRAVWSHSYLSTAGLRVCGVAEESGRLLESWGAGFYPVGDGAADRHPARYHP